MGVVVPFSCHKRSEDAGGDWKIGSVCSARSTLPVPHVKEFKRFFKTGNKHFRVGYKICLHFCDRILDFRGVCAPAGADGCISLLLWAPAPRSQLPISKIFRVLPDLVQGL